MLNRRRREGDVWAHSKGEQLGEVQCKLGLYT